MTVREKLNKITHEVVRVQGWRVPADLDFSALHQNKRVTDAWALTLVYYEAFLGDRPDLDAEEEEDE